MKLPSMLAFLATAVAETTSPAAGGGSGHANCRPNIATAQYHAKILDNYLKLWGGDLALLNQTVSPDLLFEADRFPLSARCGSGLGSVSFNVNSSAAFGQLVQSARSGFQKYGFDTDLWFASENKVVLRWSLDAIVGNYTRYPTTLKSGDPLTFNGTDILILDHCTGLVNQIYSAQDLITSFHNLGLTSVTT